MINVFAVLPIQVCYLLLLGALIQRLKQQIQESFVRVTIFFIHSYKWMCMSVSKDDCTNEINSRY